MDIMALMYASIISKRTPVYSRRDAASINYTPMRGRVCYRRLEKSSAFERHSSKFQYGRRSDRRDACLPTTTGYWQYRYTPVLRDRRCNGRVYCLNIRYNVIVASFISAIAEITAYHRRLGVNSYILTSTPFIVKRRLTSP